MGSLHNNQMDYISITCIRSLLYYGGLAPLLFFRLQWKDKMWFTFTSGQIMPNLPSYEEDNVSSHTCFLKAWLLMFPVLSLMGHRVLVLKEPSERSIFEDSRRKAGTPVPTSVERQSCIPGLGRQ